MLASRHQRQYDSVYALPFKPRSPDLANHVGMRTLHHAERARSLAP